MITTTSSPDLSTMIFGLKAGSSRQLLSNLHRQIHLGKSHVKEFLNMDITESSDLCCDRLMLSGCPLPLTSCQSPSVKGLAALKGMGLPMTLWGSPCQSMAPLRPFRLRQPETNTTRAEADVPLCRSAEKKFRAQEDCGRSEACAAQIGLADPPSARI